MSERWLNALLEQTWGNGSFSTEIEDDGTAFWALIDEFACMRPEACVAFLERTRADARDLPRFFAMKEAQTIERRRGGL